MTRTIFLILRMLILKEINCLGAKEAVVIEPLKDMPETIADIHIKASSFVTSGENRVGCDCLTSEQTTYEIL